MGRSTALRAGIGGVVLTLASTGASAAEAAAGKPSEVVFLLAILALILVGRLLGEVMQRIGQPAVVGQLLAGLLLGPSVLGVLWPAAQHALFPPVPSQNAMLEAVSSLGVLMLLLLTGMETDLKLVRRVGRAAVNVSVAGIALPFACGFLLGEMLPDTLLPHPDQRFIAALFLGTAVSISSVKIVAMVVREMNFMRRDLGQVIVASAVIDDTIGWVIIAMTFSLAAHGKVDALSLARSVGGTAVFMLASFTLGRRLVFSLIRWTNDHMVGEVPVISLIILLMICMALLTDAIGVHTVLGAFVAGILVGESPILTARIDEQLRGLIVGLFMPVFFGMAGLSADLTILADPWLLALTAGLIVIASIGKFAGAFVGGMLGGLDRRECVALAAGMNARGSTEVIVATIGLSMGVLSQNLYTMIVTMAVITTMAMPPMLRWALGRLPLGEEERERLEREEFEAQGFLANLERFLLAVDESVNGKLAARLAGIVAGARGIPITVLHVGPDAKAQSQNRGRQDSAESAIQAGAETTAATELASELEKPPKVDVVTRAKAASTKEAIGSEARRGYDLMLVGIDKTLGSAGGFHPLLAKAVGGFEGPIAVAVARGHHVDNPTDGPFRILLPTTGTEASRRAAEVAVAIARATSMPLTALYVRSGAEAGRKTRMWRHEEAVLKEVVGLADRYEVVLRTAVRADLAPDDAILRESGRGVHDLIVMGVNRRKGDVLFFGNVAQAVLERSKASILFVAG